MIFLVDVYNVFLILSDKLLIISEYKLIEVLCEVNRNVFFVFLIIWYFDFIIIIVIEGLYEILIILVGNRIDNMKMLLCIVLNMNKIVNVSIILNVECKFNI